MDILAIPAMSDEPAGGRRTVRWDRMSLSEATLERTECMKNWYQSDILKD